MPRLGLRLSLTAALVCVAVTADAAHRWGLKDGTPQLKSAGQLAFGPDGILFIGDATAAQVVAVDTKDAKSTKDTPSPNIDNLSEQLKKLTGDKGEVTVNDLAVNPISKNVYLSISIGEAKTPGIVKVEGTNKLSLVSLENIPFLAVNLPNPPEDKVVGQGPRARNRRGDAVTDLAYVEGKLLVSGLTSEQQASKIREFPFPFADRETGTPIEIYHGAHGKLEDNAVVRTFIPMTIDGKPSLLAGFTCTPLVRFSLDNIESGEKTRGTTVAELGNRNSPYDLVAYTQGNESFLLMSNNNRGVMKISTQNIGRSDGITEPIAQTAGQAYETIQSLEGMSHFDKLNDTTIVALMGKEGALSLKTVPLP